LQDRNAGRDFYRMQTEKETMENCMLPVNE
jgi:hypothetical protein